MGSEYSFASGGGIFESTPKEAPGAKFRESLEVGSFEGGSVELRKAISGEIELIYFSLVLTFFSYLMKNDYFRLEERVWTTKLQHFDKKLQSFLKRSSLGSSSTRSPFVH